LRVLAQEQEDIQVTALDSLTYLLWQARTHGQKQTWNEISQQILRDETSMRLLSSNSAWVRQRATELLGMLGDQTTALPDLSARLLHLLYGDSDSGVRACVAYVCGQIGARWAIPGLLHTLLDPDENVARTALTALSRVATVEDSIVLYAVKELTHLSHPDTHPPDRLVQAARTLLKKWRQAERKDWRKKLHSSRQSPIL
jgi:HEAT repeat protein